MKHASLFAAACALAALPLLPAAAMPHPATRAPVASSGTAVILARGDHAWNYKLRLGRDRDDAWSRGLRRFRNTFD